MDYADAIAYLDAHINYDRTGRIESPSLERMQRLMAVMGDPQHTFPVIHVTGTNGKGSTARMLDAILRGHGLSVGMYTSPHLESLNERIVWDGRPNMTGVKWASSAPSANSPALSSASAVQPT